MLYLVCLVVSIALVTDIIASSLRVRTPEFALLINPLDSDARLASIEKQFQLDGL